MPTAILPDHRGEIVAFLAQLSRGHLADGQADTIHRLLSAANYIENLGDVVESSFVTEGIDRLEKRLKVSAETRDALARFHERACASLDEALACLDSGDTQRARSLIAEKDEIDRLTNDVQLHLARRLAARHK